MWFLTHLKSSGEHRATKLARLCPKRSALQCPRRDQAASSGLEPEQLATCFCSSLGEEESWYQTYAWQCKCHFSRCAPTLLQSATGTENRYISSPPQPFSASRYRKACGCFCLFSGHPHTGSSWCRQQWYFMDMLPACWLVYPTACPWTTIIPKNKQGPRNFLQTPFLKEILHWSQQNRILSLNFTFQFKPPSCPWRRAVWSSVYKVSPSGCQP